MNVNQADLPRKPTEHLGYGIYCIDSGLGRPGLAASYLIVEGGEAAIIETGTHKCVDTILAAVDHLGVSRDSIRYIIPTHVHLDHAGGAGGLMERLPKAELIIHPLGARHMIEPAKLKAGTIAVYGEEIFASVYGDLLPIAADRVTIANDGFVFKLEDREFTCFDTPGHARHHMCIHDPASAGLFSGDTLGVSYPELSEGAEKTFIFPPTTPIHFDPLVWQSTLKHMLELKLNRIYLTNFGMVENPAKIAEDLSVQITKYADIARSCAQEENPLKAITEKLNLDVSERLKSIGCKLSVEEQQQLTSFDTTINAQGLMVWLQQQQQQQG